ncbi:laccase domain-containing protein [Schaalia sp. ZJ405]|uniref:polyphenol oxidase family protein n=1 Tax=Schaalia sp. ZJ405 TaxID=2709403 RepID=UPI0013EB4E83|nr:polyphenol oxidase family protein [Schaalia sp. ZJ405]QPK81873.1 laccase domain-containing protein [Schaalia sp. ZJ405]
MLTRGSLQGAEFALTQAGEGEEPLRGNYGLHVGDDPAAVHVRRDRLAVEVGAPIVWMNQTHSARIGVISAPDRVVFDGPVHHQESTTKVGDRVTCPSDHATQTAPTSLVLPLAGIREWGPLDCDGVIVDGRGFAHPPAVAVMTADCVPVLLSACGGRVVGAVHAGRPGLELGILDRALTLLHAMNEDEDGVNGEEASTADRRTTTDRRIHAHIGVCICGRCYEVPESMRDSFSQHSPCAASTTAWGTPALDLVAAALNRLESFGCVVTLDGRCTREDLTLHSYRRNHRCGREASVIRPGQ